MNSTKYSDTCTSIINRNLAKDNNNNDRGLAKDNNNNSHECHQQYNNFRIK